MKQLKTIGLILVLSPVGQAFGAFAGPAGRVPDEHLVYLHTKILEDQALEHLLGQFGSLASDYLSGAWYPSSGIHAHDARQELTAFVQESRGVPGFDDVLRYALHPLISYETRKTPGIFYKTGRNFPIDPVLRREIAGIMGINLDRQEGPSSLLHLAARAIPLDPAWSPDELTRRRIAAARQCPVQGRFLSGMEVNWK